MTSELKDRVETVIDWLQYEGETFGKVIDLIKELQEREEKLKACVKFYAVSIESRKAKATLAELNIK